MLLLIIYQRYVTYTFIFLLRATCHVQLCRKKKLFLNFYYISLCVLSSGTKRCFYYPHTRTRRLKYIILIFFVKEITLNCRVCSDAMPVDSTPVYII